MRVVEPAPGDLKMVVSPINGSVKHKSERDNNLLTCVCRPITGEGGGPWHELGDRADANVSGDREGLDRVERFGV